MVGFIKKSQGYFLSKEAAVFADKFTEFLDMEWKFS